MNCIDSMGAVNVATIVGETPGKRMYLELVWLLVIVLGIFSHFLVWWAYCSVVFNLWVGKFLVSQLQSGQVAILDNASFHKSKMTQQFIESADYQLLFQPAYSSDLDKIKPQWLIWNEV